MSWFRSLRRRSRDPLDQWSQDLTDAVVERFPEEQVSRIAEAAAGTSVTAAGGVAGGTVAGATAGAAATGISATTVAKIAAAVVAAALTAGGVAGLTGNLPDPLQAWLSEVVDGIGIDLPHPDDVVPIEVPEPDLPPVTVTVPGLPEATLPGVTVPELPSVTVPAIPEVTIPEVTIPGATIPGSG